MRFLKKLSMSDWMGIVGLVLTFVIFVAQEGVPDIHDQKQWRKYQILLGVVLTVAVFYVLGRIIWTLGRKLADYRDGRNLFRAALASSTQVVKVKNTDGDARLEEIVRIKIFRPNTDVRKSKRHFLFTEARLDKFIPDAKLLKSNVENLAINTVVLNDGEKTVIGGVPGYRYEWCYEFVPPLFGKGTFVEYAYAAELPNSEASAFSELGSDFFLYHDIDYVVTDLALQAPSGYRIEIVETYLKDCDGERQELQSNDRPVMQESGEGFTWKPQFIKAATHLCHYRLVPRNLPTVEEQADFPVA